MGVLAFSLGRLDQAVAHFEQACLSAGKQATGPSWPGRVLATPTPFVRETVPKSQQKPWSLDESLAISSELGVQPLMERALSRREILGA